MAKGEPVVFRWHIVPSRPSLWRRLLNRLQRRPYQPLKPNG